MTNRSFRKRIVERWERNDGLYNGWLRETRHGFEVVDRNGNVIAGPNFDLGTVVRMAHDLGVEVRAEDLGNQS